MTGFKALQKHLNSSSCTSREGGSKEVEGKREKERVVQAAYLSCAGLGTGVWRVNGFIELANKEVSVRE